MIAAKAFDPVVGVDIHIIQPPGPVPPVPVPHPFVGMLIDPMDFAPVIGATVLVNGMPRATAGTGGQCIPPHIPIGGVFVKPPANECEIFMGSSTVLADGDPLSFLGMPALSCHDVGIPPPPRIKKKRKPKSLTLPTSVVLAVPAGPPVLVGGPPTISMMALGMKAAMAGLGKAFKKLRRLQKASKKMKALSDRVHGAARKAMDRLGVPPSVQNRVHRAICTATGHPVDVATGKVFTETLDLHLPGLLPFDFQRVWYSSSTYQGPLGHGWHHSYDLKLIADDRTRTVAVRMSDGRPVAFPGLAEGESFTNPTERLTLRRDSRGYALLQADRSTCRFVPLGPPGEPQVLASIEDNNGNALHFAYDNVGRLTGVRDTAGRIVSVATDQSGRITGLFVPDPRDPSAARPAVTYHYNEDGDLVEVRDALGYALRYAYSNHLMVRETDRAGHSYHFVYDGPAPGARCVRTWGDNGVFARTLEYDGDVGVTAVADGGGHTMRYYWNAAGVVERIIDAQGAEKQFVWDNDSRLLAELFPDGTAMSYEYDAAGNQTAVTDASGATTATAYNALNLITAQVNPAGDRWSYDYDQRGNLISVTNPLGNAIRYVNDARGLPVEIHDAAGGTTRLTWDERGDLVRISDRGGRATNFHYDALGRLVGATDPLRQRSTFSYDEVGRLSHIEHPDSSTEQFAYDGASRLIEYVDPLGRTRRFRYGSGERPTERIDHDGRRVRFEYDVENRLTAIINENGAVYQLEYDTNDNVTTEIGFDGRTHRYDYSAAGHLIRRRESSSRDAQAEQVISYARDALGRLTRKLLPEGTAEFFYDAVGRLVKATNPSCDVTFEYDAIGNLVRESQAGHTITHTYDALGNRTQTTYPNGDVLDFDNTDTNITRLRLNGAAIVVSERDALQRERRRSQGVLDSTYDYDPVGRLKRHHARSASGTVILREYGYDRAGHLSSIRDAQDGTVSFTYDVLGRLTEMLSPQAREVLAFDPADNLLGSDDPGPKRPVLNNRIGAYRGVRLEYDAYGNVATKRRNADVGYRFRYDAEHRLVEALSVTFGITRRTAYIYDALGRRIAKRTGDEEVAFIWSGGRLAQQRSNGRTQSFAYYPRSMVPIATWSEGVVNHFHCDHAGAPVALTRHDDGRLLWTARYRAFGGTDATAIVEQPFRFQGQYWDSETGLHYNRFRYYDPDTGRYLTQDPIGLAGGFNPYVYSPDPINYIDPLGLQRRWVPLGDGWEAGVDQFNTGGRASHEMHIYNAAGAEVGVVGPDGEWIPKHGHPPTRPPSVSDDMCRRINGVNVDQLRREGHVVDRTRSRAMYNRTCGR